MTVSVNNKGKLSGIGVGPGPAGYLPLAVLAALRSADVVYLPRARGADASVALQCLAGVEFDRTRLREIEFNMDPDRQVLQQHYAQLGEELAAQLRQGLHVAYLTIGDSLTYSTYGYVLAAVRDLYPDCDCVTYPGITSYAAAASALEWPLGVGKERTLILPCPEDAATLRAEIESHDIVVLMKVGARLPWVLELLRAMGIAQHCAFARRIGLEGEVLASDLTALDAAQASGYLAVLLIRKTAQDKRHLPQELKGQA